MLVLESNQNHATAQDTEICPTLPASMGLGGGYVPMIVVNMFGNVVQIEMRDIAPPFDHRQEGAFQ